MESIGVISFILIIANFLISFNAFRDSVFLDKWKFRIDDILIHGEYKRILTSGFLHVGWLHLIMNMLALYSFSDSLELRLGYFYFILIYFSSLIGGNLFSLYIHRNHGDYSAVGASGAISGLIFSYIALFPGSEIGILGFFMPSWVFGILFVLISIYGIKTQMGNIGHDAHLGGAMVGLICSSLLFPKEALDNIWVIASISIPVAIFIFLIVKFPYILFLPSFSLKPSKINFTLEDKFNEQRLNKQKELDRILDKISEKGMNSLTPKEKQILEELSEK